MDPICRDSDNTNEISSLQVLNVVDDVLDAIITTQQIYYFQTTRLIKPNYYSKPWPDIRIKPVIKVPDFQLHAGDTGAAAFGGAR